MTETAQVRVGAALSVLMQLETAIGIAAVGLSDLSSGHAGAERFASKLLTLSEAHLHALERRALALAPPQPGDDPMAPDPGGDLGPVTNHRLSQALPAAAGKIFEAVSAYAVLLHLACRARDSWIVASEGTSAHLARQCLQDYQLLLGELPALVGEVVAWELDAAASPCRCLCAGCGAGFCMCPQSMVWREAWTAARNGMESLGVRIPTPRPDSTAASAGLRDGDVIVGIDGVPIDSGPAFMTALMGHDPGTTFSVLVRRSGTELALRAVRPSQEDGRTPPDSSECTQPSGDQFYFDRARELQRRVRRGGKPVLPHPDGLASLSPRELQVLRLVCDGATNPMIATKLRIERATAARHVQNILAKLGTVNRSEAAALAAAAGMFSD